MNNAVDNQIIYYKSLSSVIEKNVTFKPLIGNNSQIFYWKARFESGNLPSLQWTANP
jgi:hypothetical protein